MTVPATNRMPSERVRVFQRKLYRAAKQQAHRQFGNLYDKVYRWDVLTEAWRRVARNDGSAGVDGQSIEWIEKQYGVERFLLELQTELQAERYDATAIRRVYIPKGDGRQRPLGIPTVKDRVVQMAVKLVIEPLFEADFLDCSYGFRPQRMPSALMTPDTELYVNSSGQFVIGGPVSDTGFTGRKIIVDSYGTVCPHGGGAFSGKDPTKVDRSAAYMARYVAKNVVAAGLADYAQLQVSYTIGKSHPLSISIETLGTGKVADTVIEELIRKHFDFRPEAIIRHLGLRRPIYRPVAAYGHFGRTDLDLPWEKTDKAEALRKEAGV